MANSRGNRVPKSHPLMPVQGRVAAYAYFRLDEVEQRLH